MFIRLFKGMNDILHGMSVCLNDMPSKRSPFICQRFKWHNLFGITINLNVITVNNGHEMI